MTVSNGVILVTGANGLVGSALRRLQDSNMVFTSHNEVDLTDFSETKKLFESVRPEYVIHTAAVVGGIGANMAHPGSFLRDNVLINNNTFEAARLSGVKKLVSFVSTCAFPDNARYPLTVTDFHNGPPHPSNFGYAYAKRLQEAQSRAYRKEWNCDFVVGVGTNIYGPNDNFSLDNGHVLPALIHRCFLAKQKNIELRVWGSGKALREFVLADDIARLSVWALKCYSSEEPIIFSSGVETSIHEVVNLIANILEFNGKIVFDQTKPDGQLRKPSDNTSLKTLLPDFVFTSVGSGLETTIDWFLKNYPTIRQ